MKEKKIAIKIPVYNKRETKNKSRLEMAKRSWEPIQFQKEKEEHVYF